MRQATKRPAMMWAGVLWIGGLGVLIGSVIFSTVGLASGVTPPAGQTVTANQGSAGPAAWPVGVTGALPSGSNTIGNVGITGALPGGRNDIGTVHVADPSRVNGSDLCSVDDTKSSCTIGSSSSGIAIINTVSVLCFAAPQHVLSPEYDTGGGGIELVPLTPEGNVPGRGNTYGATFTNLGVGGGGTFVVNEDYTATSGNGSECAFYWWGTTS